MSDVAQDGYYANSRVSSESPACLVGFGRVTAEPVGRMGDLSETSRPDGLFPDATDIEQGVLPTLGLDRMRALGVRTSFVLKEVHFAAASFGS